MPGEAPGKTIVGRMRGGTGPRRGSRAAAGGRLVAPGDACPHPGRPVPRRPPARLRSFCLSRLKRPVAMGRCLSRSSGGGRAEGAEAGVGINERGNDEEGTRGSGRGQGARYAGKAGRAVGDRKSVV